jgi:hypothetical protein
VNVYYNVLGLARSVDVCRWLLPHVQVDQEGSQPVPTAWHQAHVSGWHARPASCCSSWLYVKLHVVHMLYSQEHCAFTALCCLEGRAYCNISVAAVLPEAAA